MTIRYTGLIAPEETPTGDSRLFKAGGGTTRALPITVMAKFESGGHVNATIVGNLVSWYDGPGGKWGSIDFMDPEVVPEVTKACYMLDRKAIGPSVDLDQDYTVQAIPHPKRPDKKAAYFLEYNVVGVTLVPMPAFAEVHLSADTVKEKALLASAGVEIELTHFDINLKAWDSWPLAPREYKFDADDAVKRIAAWSGIGSKTPSLDHYASTFLWRDGSQAGDTLAQDSFRLPLADIINGQPHLIYHAVYAAAALLSGGHGGLPNIPAADQERMKGVINQIYAKMAQTFGDSGMKSPFMGGGRQESQMSIVDEDCACEEEFAVTEPYGDVKYADPGYRDNKKRYPIDTEEHVRAAWSYINQEKNAAEYSPEQLKSIKSKIMTAAKKLGIEISEDAADDMSMKKTGYALLAGIAPIAPPRAVFNKPVFAGPTKFTIAKDGRVFGHVAEWRKCHIGIGNACVMAPRNKSGYKYFTLGSVICDDGSEVDVGVISYGSAHANDKYGVMPAREFYDNSSKGGAIVTIGEDRYGIWVAGTLTPNITEADVAELRRSKLSGDWREVEGAYELVAALAVNAPGFPIVRHENGSIFSMTGVGIVDLEGEVEIVEDVQLEVAASFAAKLEEVNAKEEARKTANKTKRLGEVDSERQKLAETSQSTMLARQYDAKFVVIPETQDAK